MNEWQPALRTAPPTGVKKRRKATAMDRVRAKEIVRRIAEGEEEADAYWAVASDLRIGFSRFRAKTERPADFVLIRKMAALFERAVPGVIGAARDTALLKLAGLADDAVLAVEEVVRGEGTDSRAARARLDAAKTILASIGIAEKGGVTVATQINVDQGMIRGVPDGA